MNRAPAFTNRPPAFEWWDGPAGAQLDQIICSCGWESATYFDGQQFAHTEWKQHIIDSHRDKNKSSGIDA